MRTASDVDGADDVVAGDVPDDDRFDRRSIEAVDPAGSATHLCKQPGDLHHEGFAEAAEDVLTGLDVPGAFDDIVIVFVGDDPALLQIAQARALALDIRDLQSDPARLRRLRGNGE